MPLTTMFVEVLTSVTELVTIEANASGMRSFDALTPDFFAMPKTIGRKNAVEAVLLMNAPMPAEASMTIQSSRSGSVPAWRNTARPASSTTPVRSSAAVRMSRPRIMMTVSLPKPANACFAGSSPVKASASSRPSAMTSDETRSHQNSASAAASRQRRRRIWGVMIGRILGGAMIHRIWCRSRRR